jgi:serine/threonine-protein kinase RsbW
LRPSGTETGAESGTELVSDAAALGLAPLQLAVRYDAAAFEQARLALLQHLAELNLGPRTLYRLELVLEEGLMNRLWHAWPEGAPQLQTQHIGLSLRVLPDALELGFEDEGRPFDPTLAPEKQLPETLEQARPGGLGLMLTRKAVRSMHYERRDGRNWLTLQIARE